MRSSPQHPVLVHGPRKAGTTLLQDLLDGTPDLLVVPGEMKLRHLHALVLATPAERLRYYVTRGRTLFGELFDVNGEDRPVLTPKRQVHASSLGNDEVHRLLDVEAYGRDLTALGHEPPVAAADLYQADAAAFRRALRDAGPTRWASKEVGMPSDAILAHFMSLYPAGRVVLIARDPRFVVRSIVTDRRRRGVRLSAPHLLLEMHEVHRILAYYGRVLDSDAVLLVCYEDLVADTESVMRRVAAHLHIAFDPILLRPTNLGLPVRVSTASRDAAGVFAGAEDWRDGLDARDRLALGASIAAYGLVRRVIGESAKDYAALRARANQPRRH